jgi:hypothetical protein
MPEGLVALRRREHRERRSHRYLLTVGADPHVSTSGGWDHQDRKRIEALLTEMPREGRERRGSLHLPDLGNAEGQTTARPGWRRLGLLTRVAYHVPIAHLASSSAVAPACVVRSRHDRRHAAPLYPDTVDQ